MSSTKNLLGRLIPKEEKVEEAEVVAKEVVTQKGSEAESVDKAVNEPSVSEPQKLSDMDYNKLISDILRDCSKESPQLTALIKQLLQDYKTDDRDIYSIVMIMLASVTEINKKKELTIGEVELFGAKLAETKAVISDLPEQIEAIYEVSETRTKTILKTFIHALKTDMSAAVAESVEPMLDKVAIKVNENLSKSVLNVTESSKLQLIRQHTMLILVTTIASASVGLAVGAFSAIAMGGLVL